MMGIPLSPSGIRAKRKTNVVTDGMRQEAVAYIVTTSGARKKRGNIEIRLLRPRPSQASNAFFFSFADLAEVI